MFIDASESKAGLQLLEVVRGMCGLPAAIIVSPQPPKVLALIRDVRRAGRIPVLLGGYGRTLFQFGGVPRKVMSLHTVQDGQTLTVPPLHTTPFNLAVWMTVPTQ